MLQHYWSLTIALFSLISRTLVGGVIPLYREAVGVFYSRGLGLCPLNHSTLVRGGYPSAEMLSVYSIAPAPAHWATGHSLEEGLTPLQRCSRCILQSQPTSPFMGGVLPHFRDTVSVFFSPHRLGNYIELYLYICASIFIRIF